MADSSSKPCTEQLTDENPESCRPELSSPAQLLQLRGELQSEDDQSNQQADPMSPVDDPVSKDFARTRSPLSVDQTDQATKYCDPSVEDYEDTESDTSNPSPRISPFTADFMSANAVSSIFFKRKAILPRQLKEAPVDAAKSQIKSEQQPALSQDKDITPDDAPDNSLSQSATHLEDPTNQDSAEEKSENVHAVTERRDMDVYLVGADLPETKVATEPATPPGILTILDEEIDQQFTDKGYTSLEPDSTNTLPLTSTVPDVCEEPQPLWTPELREVLEDSVDNSFTTGLDDPLQTRYSDIDGAQAIEQQEVDTAQECLDKEDIPVSFETEVAENTSINHDHDDESTADTAAALTKSQDAHNATPPQQDVDEQHPKNPIPDSLDSPPGSHPHTSVLIDSPDGSDKITFQPPISQPGSPQSAVLVDQKEFCPTQDRNEDQTQAPGNGLLAESPEGGEKEDSSLVICHEWDVCPKMETPESSAASSKSRTHPEDDRPSASPEMEEDTSSPNAPDLQFVQTRMLVNQALQDFKVDLLQQIESVVQQSTRALIPAKNSAAATILARPSPPQLETAIRLSISNAQTEIMNAVDLDKAEAIRCTLRTAESTKAHFTEVTDALKKTVVEHIDHRLDSLKEMFVELKSDLSESSTQNEAYLKSIVTDSFPSESLTVLKKLPEVVEQAKALALTNTKEVSRKLEEHAAKVEVILSQLHEKLASNQLLQNEIVSNLCKILTQSTLQNNAINNLATVINPLGELVKGISYDTNLIDAKLAKNASILTSIIDRTEALEKAATRFDKVFADAESKFETATTKMDQVAKIASSVNATHIAERFEALQGQTTTMQSQLGQIAATLAATTPVNNARNDGGSASHTSTHIGRVSNQSEPTSGTASTQVEYPESRPEPRTFTIDASFQLNNGKLLKPPKRTSLPISESSTVFTILSNFRSAWTRELIKQGVITAKMELISIWVSSADSMNRRVVDNDTAYRGWYKAATSGRAWGSQLLHFEFIDCSKDHGDRTEEPRSKKRKQDVMRRGSETGVEFGLDVWRNMRQTRFERTSEYGRLTSRLTAD